jgi:hypothetical protein
MAIVERVKGICLKPKDEWAVIAGETTTPAALYKGYVIPLAAIGPIASFIGLSIVGMSVPFVGTYRTPIGMGITGAVVRYLLALVAVFVISLIINALAPSFKAEKNSTQALKVAVYAYTPAWIASALYVLPWLGVIGGLVGLYGLYLLYLGLPRLMKCPEDKAVGYTAVVVVCAIVLSFVIGGIAGAVVGFGRMGSMMGPGGLHSDTSGSVQFDKDSPLGKLQGLSQAMEASTRKMEAAQRSGDTNAQAAAATEALGTLLGGGKHVDPVGIDQLKPLIPATLAGLPKTSSNAEKAGMAGLMVSKAEAAYGDGAQKRVTLEISDTGGARGLMALAGWAGVAAEREDDNGFERTQKVNGRLVHEKGSKGDGSNEFTIVLGDRFIVSAKGRGVDLPTLKSAVSSLDLAKIEAMKNVGVAN